MRGAGSVALATGAMAWACGGPIVGTVEGSGTTQHEMMGSASSSTGSTSDARPSTSDTGFGETADLPQESTGCPAAVEIALCLPETETEPEFCLCSRQFLGTANDAIVGDLDGNGLDDVFIHNSFGNTGHAWYADRGALVQSEPVDWPSITTFMAPHYVTAIGALVLERVVGGELHFHIIDEDLNAGPAHTLALTGFAPTAAFGDFDANGVLDVVTAVEQNAHLVVTTHLDAIANPVSSELLNVPVDDTTLGAHVWMTARDVDGDGADDLALQATEDQLAKIYWSASGEGTPFGTLDNARYVRGFDFEADGRQEILVHGAAPLGQLQLVAQPQPRQLENGGAVPVEETLEAYGNQAYPLRLDDRFAAIAIGPALGAPRAVSSGLGVAYFGALDATEPMRTTILEGVDARIWGTLDVEGDGRDEVLVGYDSVRGEPGLYLFDVTN